MHHTYPDQHSLSIPNYLSKQSNQIFKLQVSCVKTWRSDAPIERKRDWLPSQEMADDDEGAPPAMAPPPLPPDYSGVESGSNMGWVNHSTQQTVSQAVSPTVNPVSDDWGGWGSTPAVVKEENGADPWDFVPTGGPEAPKVPAANASGTNQVIGLTH